MSLRKKQTYFKLGQTSMNSRTYHPWRRLIRITWPRKSVRICHRQPLYNYILLYIYILLYNIYIYILLYIIYKWYIIINIYIYNIQLYIYMHTGSYWNISMVICLYVLNNGSQAHSTKVYGANVGNQWYQKVCIWVVSKFLWTSWTTTLIIFNLQKNLCRTPLWTKLFLDTISSKFSKFTEHNSVMILWYFM